MVLSIRMLCAVTLIVITSLIQVRTTTPGLLPHLIPTGKADLRSDLLIAGICFRSTQATLVVASLVRLVQCSHPVARPTELVACPGVLVWANQHMIEHIASRFQRHCCCSQTDRERSLSRSPDPPVHCCFERRTTDHHHLTRKPPLTTLHI